MLNTQFFYYLFPMICNNTLYISIPSTTTYKYLHITLLLTPDAICASHNPHSLKFLHTTRTGRPSARLRPSVRFFCPFRPECTAEAQDTGWLCFCRRGALLRWWESALLKKIQLFERRRSEFWIFFSGFSRFPAS